jgi:hypothetical protein
MFPSEENFSVNFGEMALLRINLRGFLRLPAILFLSAIWRVSSPHPEESTLWTGASYRIEMLAMPLETELWIGHNDSVLERRSSTLK